MTTLKVSTTLQSSIQSAVRALSPVEGQALATRDFRASHLALLDILGFARNYEIAGKKFNTAIDEIDKSINHLQKTRDALMASDRQLRRANDKAQDVTIKKLTYGNPTMKAKVEEVKKP